MKKRKSGFTMLNPAKTTTNKRYLTGFTLIELLVVIAIIAILVTVAIIGIAKAREKSIKAKVASDMSVVAKIGAACKSFGGTINKYPSPYVANQDICNTSTISDSTETSAATGKYPKVDSNFTITALDLDIGGIKVYYGKKYETMTVTTEGIGKWVRTPLKCSQNGTWKKHSTGKYYYFLFAPKTSPTFTAQLTNCNRTPLSVVWDTSAPLLTFSNCPNGGLTCIGARKDPNYQGNFIFNANVEGVTYTWFISYRAPY